MLNSGHDAVAFGLACRLSYESQKAPQNVASRFKAFKKALNAAAQYEGLRGQVKVGCYRMAFVTDSAVYKFQYNDHPASCLISEYRFIQQMRQSSYARHFPESALVQGLRVPVLVQERVNMDHRKIPETLHMQAKLLGKRLGLEDLHQGNYGWKGARRAEYPVFIDVDFHSEEHRGFRSWFISSLRG